MPETSQSFSTVSLDYGGTNQQRAVTAAFALPPPLWKHFTRENLDRLEQIKTEASKYENSHPNHKKELTPSELRALDLPPELRFLVSPKTPTGEYSVFGEQQTLSTKLPSLEEQGVKQLYPDPVTDSEQDPSKPSLPLNHAYYILKISKSLLLDFLEFVGILSVSPEQFESKVDDMRNLLLNAHHLVNLYRPHQARESLIMLLEEQLARSKQKINRIDRARADIEITLGQLEAEGKQTSSAAQAEGVSQPEEDARRAIEDSLGVASLGSRQLNKLAQ